MGLYRHQTHANAKKSAKQLKEIKVHTGMGLVAGQSWPKYAAIRIPTMEHGWPRITYTEVTIDGVIIEIPGFRNPPLLGRDFKVKKIDSPMSAGIWRLK